MGLKNLLADEHTKAKVDIDAPETTILHGEIIRKKRFLRGFYDENYQFFKKESEGLPEGLKVELGSGAGYIKDFLPEVKTSDVLELPGNDLHFSALDMPFESNSVSAIYMIDVLHHIPNVHQFLKEADRCLQSGGKIIMTEPANTWWGRFIYRNFHHEPFEPNAENWKLPPGGPMSMANGALPWIVFVRDRARFEIEFPGLSITHVKFMYPFTYLLSGGVSMRQLMPGWMYPIIRWKEEVILGFLREHLGMFMRVVVTKK